MADKIYLVQNDTRPTLTVSLTDQATGLPININGATPKLYLRQVGSTTVKATLTGVVIGGAVQADGTINGNAPYNVAGVGGRCAFNWSSDALNTAGDFEGEVEIFFPDGTTQTVYQTLKFKVRQEFS